MKAAKVREYLLVAFGVLWLTLSVLLRRTMWSVFWREGAPDPTTVGEDVLVSLLAKNHDCAQNHRSSGEETPRRLRILLLIMAYADGGAEADG